MPLPQAIDPDLLRAFLLIAEGHSFTRAAELVGRTQSAVSMQVKRLEDVLGQAVFERGKGGAVELTAHGQYLLDRARTSPNRKRWPTVNSPRSDCGY